MLTPKCGFDCLQVIAPFLLERGVRQLEGCPLSPLLFNIFNLMGVSRFAHLIVKGVVVIIGVALYSTRKREARS